MSSSVPPARPRRHYATPDSVAVRFAQAIGVTAPHAAQLAWGNHNLRDRVIAFITVCHTARREDVLRRWMQPILDAFHSRPPVPWTPALELEAQAADNRAETERTRYLLHATKAEAEARVRAIDQDMLELATLRSALVDRWAL